MYYYTIFATVLCDVILVGNTQGLTNLHLDTGQGTRSFAIAPNWNRDDQRFSEAITQIMEYFTGTRQHFDIKLNPDGTDFQKQVWKELTRIPYGETRSYGEIAKAIGKPTGSRAVGAANGKNPIPLIVPCHRVIGASGKLAGFAHGLEAKKWLLKLEGAL